MKTFFNKYEYELLFRVLSDRSERGSTIVMTNLPLSKWTELFGNTTMVSALVGRLTYRSHVFDMIGPSYRLMSTQGEGSARSSGLYVMPTFGPCGSSIHSR